MGVQTSDGPIVFDDTDWKRTVNNVRLGIKVRIFTAISAVEVLLCEQQQDGSWLPVLTIEDAVDVRSAIVGGGGIDVWIQNVVTAKLNTYLQQRFPGTPLATHTLLADQSGEFYAMVARAIFICVILKTPLDLPNVKRIAVLGDSISTRNNGAASHAWPELLESMIRSLGVFDISVRNYSVPGLTWRQAFTPTPQRMIAQKLSPVDAVKRDGCDLLLIYMGVNDRQSPTAKADAQAFRDSLGDLPYLVARQSMYDEQKPSDSIVTASEQAAMDDAYTVFGDKFITVGGLNLLYRCGYSFDTLHPTDSGKQWIAANFYLWLQKSMPLTLITRNGWWLANQPPEIQAQMAKAQM